MKNLKPLSSTLIVTFCLLVFTFNFSAQSVGINNTGSAPDASSLLDLNTTDKGFLITRVDTANITTPAFGLMTLSPIDSCLYLFNGIKWMGMGGGGFDCDCNLPSPPFKCGDLLADDRDNIEYGTVKIGNQCWMSENLNYETSSGTSSCYNNDINECDIHGRLYTWDIAMNGASSINTNPSGVQGICSTGWHLPSDVEWIEMEMAIGMTAGQANGTEWRGTDEGNKLKEAGTANWNPVNNGTNSVGFNARGSGYQEFNNGIFVDKNKVGYWWTTMEKGTEGWHRDLNNNRSTVRRHSGSKGYGFSVRCIMD